LHGYVCHQQQPIRGKIVTTRKLGPGPYSGTRVAFLHDPLGLTVRAIGEREVVVNLAFWLPTLFLLGLATFAGLFAFIIACDKV
jgi:hypothetical protein